MNIEELEVELEEALEQICVNADLLSKYKIITSPKTGEVIIHTGLFVDNHGELVEMAEEESEEEDPDFDDSFETLVDDEEEADDE